MKINKSILVIASVAALALTGCGDKKKDTRLNMAGYELKFEDNFDGDTLNENDWNYELHEPGWVNNELQAYIKSDKNVYLKDGNLVIQPVKDGDYYTSGRVNTQGKHDFKYGLFETRLKVPQGKGFLPAFWMMPTNESIYGMWPKCGEIDIMEVLGDKTDTSYATLHFGEPHTMSQVTKRIDGNFAEEFHTFACEWEPGRMRFYVDGVLTGDMNEWFTKKVNEEEEPWPAPYNQDFYMIFNVAVGGNWPGYPDAGTTFDEKAQMVVDYVRVYQKKSYKEDIKKKEDKFTGRNPDKDGNYVENGNFEAEDLGDEKGWIYKEDAPGNGKASISKNVAKIESNRTGGQEHSVQFVQPLIPLEKGYEYEFSFDAWASGNRKMKAGICAPYHGWVRYFGDVSVNLETERKTYTYKFVMNEKSDPEARIDFNMGAQGSKETIYIANVKLHKLGKAKVVEKKDMKKEGELLYNGDFTYGTKVWEFYAFDGSTCSVSCDEIISDATGKKNENAAMVNIKDTKDVDWKIQLMQKRISLKKDHTYKLEFDAWSTLPRKIKYALQRDGALWKATHGNEDWTPYNGAPDVNLGTSYQHYEQEFVMEYDDDDDVILTFSMGSIESHITTEHDVFLDNVKLVEVK